MVYGKPPVQGMAQNTRLSSGSYHEFTLLLIIMLSVAFS